VLDSEIAATFDCRLMPIRIGWRCYTPVMTLKTAALFAFLGTTLLTVMLAVVFIRDVSSLMAGAIAFISVLAALIRMLASLSVAVFLYVFYRAQP
jgi:hypothetical protein